MGDTTEDTLPLDALFNRRLQVFAGTAIIIWSTRPKRRNT
jgi:hypothetical protein